MDARQVATGSVLRADVCIVGAGAAGITLARELAPRGIDVCLVESGGLAPDEATLSLDEAETAGAPAICPTGDRRRGFGGSMRAWSGRCRPLDPCDFEERPWVPDSGWPFTREELDPYYQRARRHLQLPGCLERPLAWERRRFDATAASPVVLQRMEIAPLDFASGARRELSRSRRAEIVTSGTATELETPGAAVERLRVATLGGNHFFVRARCFVLAAGGIENPRLLLVSSRHRAAGLGNEHDCVGRYFMDHPYRETGLFDASGARFASGTVAGERRDHGLWAASGRFARDEGLLRGGAYLHRRLHYAELPRHRTPGVEAIRATRSAWRRGQLSELKREQLFAAVRGLGDVGRHALTRAGELLRPRRELVLRSVLEPAPNRESRITLTDELDPLGVRRVRVCWRMGELERRSWARVHSVLDGALRELGLTRISGRADGFASCWPEGVEAGKHHMGATRMHRDPKRGVVDEHGRVHGVENLFVAGSSVFPTYGYANPTYTIVALAIRLADRISRG